ncbi:hypothetical protein tpqmel_0400 [Candidatus Gastranaerophilus sp. (ex Termes propinquus)]|nr:hypothetical protein tpqmel_0400 [Candidatus Gastranaerophilus sp. (ex Termes propinquus)]
MSTKHKPIVHEKSSKKVATFLEENSLHKKDFAQMIGVTLSYVYNLIDESIPFSSRTTTLERIAAVMDVEPEAFDEYVISQEPTVHDKNLEIIKKYIKKNKLSTLDFLKQFERKKRLGLVDMMRGAKSIPINFAELKNIATVLDIPNSEIFDIWQGRMVEYLNSAGFDMTANEELASTMFECAKKYAESL